ncbi:L-allo-threonine aldolase [Rubrobacter xylanophilus DSM 9941]|uniref:low-specificity L-threonine aldolase n=1 Tax=Rubrobacter xylanophilus TaxID=49319 RepID=UPI001C63DA55|nr:low-specificity L-threonine aldolase [Rubrobacter xylanophilus]QYJ16995.1 L-allo-threonine aldolase [Rubrobacter xylanophilus DSM 9941]
MIDLRSDTVTRPSEGMRRAMYEAPVGDDVFREDPTVNRLEEYVADLLGKEAALYAPSGTMTNQVGIHVNTSRGDEILVHEGAHVYNYEAGAPALLSGVQIRPLPGEGGVIAPETLRDAIRPEDDHFPRARLLCLENTHNAAGGRVYPLEEFTAVAAEARRHGLRVHLDGARLFNAQVATGIPAREWAAHADTVSVCSSKGLGAPVGSLLAGDEETIREARRVRKAFGGGMRQAGVIAAAALYAFENNIERLAEDHERARRLAGGLAAAGYEVEPPETNMVLVRVEDVPGFLRELARREVLATPGRPGYVRFCTHLDVGDEEIERAVERVAGLVSVAGRR